MGTNRVIGKVMWVEYFRFDKYPRFRDFFGFRVKTKGDQAQSEIELGPLSRLKTRMQYADCMLGTYQIKTYNPVRYGGRLFSFGGSFQLLVSFIYTSFCWLILVGAMCYIAPEMESV